ncbi:hypothetical protein TNCV_931171 [Trichonephila clavipes]|uniref:Uncharacterized protein n=1 Tax=Trichonephila clavipes TaxID=2585209 RepID=A0A8X6W321_TRICX|nr:hypothetical protein TNCV_931171 [Trichonephila clavipes]
MDSIFRPGDQKIECKNFNAHVSIPDNRFILHDDEEPIDICQLPTEESGCLTDEKDIDEDTFQSVLPADV